MPFFFSKFLKSSYIAGNDFDKENLMMQYKSWELLKLEINRSRKKLCQGNESIITYKEEQEIEKKTWEPNFSNGVHSKL